MFLNCICCSSAQDNPHGLCLCKITYRWSERISNSSTLSSFSAMSVFSLLDFGMWTISFWGGLMKPKLTISTFIFLRNTLPEWHVRYKLNIYNTNVIIRMRSLTEMFQLVLYPNRNHPSICHTWHGNFSRHTRRSLHGCHPSLLRDLHHSRCTLHRHMCLQRQGEIIGSMVKVLKVKLSYIPIVNHWHFIHTVKH